MYRYKVSVVKVVDGDTVDVNIDLGFGMSYKKQRVRMLGIDTPESRTRDLVEKKFGKASKKHLGACHGEKKQIQSFINFFGGEKKTQGSFEAQIAAICDDIAYNNNDIDDGLYAGLFEIEELNELEIIKDALKKINLKKS